MVLRDMAAADLDAVMLIEKEAFVTPWSRLSFEAELEKSYARCLVAERNGRAIGYLIGWILSDEAHIANVAVARSHRRRGVAEALIREFLTRSVGCVKVFLEVRQSNRAARQLYQKLGFYEIAVRKNYYEEEGEDALVMKADL